MKLWLGIGALVAVVAGLVAYGVHLDHRWGAWCRSQGGHVVDHVSTSTGVSAKGQPVVSTNVTSFCLSADGRILGVQ